MIDTLTQPTARLDLSRAVTLLDPSAERRNRRWGSQLAAEETDPEEQERAQRLAAEWPSRPREQRIQPAQRTQPERVSPEIPAATAATQAASPMVAALPDTPRPEGVSETPSSELRRPESPGLPVPRTAAARAEPWPTGKQPKAEKPEVPQRATSLPASAANDEPPGGTAPEPPRQERQQSLNLRMAGFPEACVEQPAGKGSPVGRPPEAGFTKAAPGSDLALSGNPAARRGGAAASEDAVAPAAGLTRAVQILSKPTPRYPEQALRLGAQGDVLLDVEFRYSGSVEVLGVRRGIGHGLNESAIEAARRIGFAPARRDGRAVDMQATLRIRFQLLP